MPVWLCHVLNMQLGKGTYDGGRFGQVGAEGGDGYRVDGCPGEGGEGGVGSDFYERAAVQGSYGVVEADSLPGVI
ncbi:hypothetical protein, partial [Streptomyces niveus]|uniref:hypothetical protein n=1 Tax=Streptomyces niveus TaxID=193462 RepID=UPI00344E6348